MDTDKFVEQLQEWGISDDKIKEIQKVLSENKGKTELDTDNGKVFLHELETRLLLEKDPTTRAKLAAKIISIRLD